VKGGDRRCEWGKPVNALADYWWARARSATGLGAVLGGDERFGLISDMLMMSVAGGDAVPGGRGRRLSSVVAAACEAGRWGAAYRCSRGRGAVWGGSGVQMLLMFTVSFFLIVHAQHELREYIDPSLVVTSNTIEGP